MGGGRLFGYGRTSHHQLDSIETNIVIVLLPWRQARAAAGDLAPARRLEEEQAAVAFHNPPVPRVSTLVYDILSVDAIEMARQVQGGGTERRWVRKTRGKGGEAGEGESAVAPGFACLVPHLTRPRLAPSTHTNHIHGRGPDSPHPPIHQMALVEHEIYRRITPLELVGRKWAGPTKNVDAPNVVAASVRPCFVVIILVTCMAGVVYPALHILLSEPSWLLAETL